MKLRLHFDSVTDICIGMEALEYGRLRHEIRTSPYNKTYLEHGEQYWLSGASQSFSISREFELDFYPLGKTIESLLGAMSGLTKGK